MVPHGQGSDRGGGCSLNPGRGGVLRNWIPVTSRRLAFRNTRALPSNAFHLRGIDVKASWPCCQGIQAAFLKGHLILYVSAPDLCGMTKSGSAHSPGSAVFVRHAQHLAT